MITFELLSIRNFLSFGNIPTNIQLNFSGSVLILGENLDNTDGGSVANGTGKTSIINALVYALYDKPISNISKDNLVNNRNKRNMEVSITFRKNKDQYTIKRFRKQKSGAAGNYVQFFRNGVDKTPDSNSNTNKLIENTIGIPYDLFVRIVAFPATLKPFLNLPLRSKDGANQTDIIEELFNIKTLSEKALVLKEVIKDTERSLETVNLSVEHFEREYNTQQSQIKNTKRRIISWESDKDKEVQDIERKLKKIQEVDIDEQKALQEKQTELKDAIRKTTADLQRIERETSKEEKIIKKNKDELKHLLDAECPYCHQQFKDTETNITDCEIKIDAAEIAIVSIGVKHDTVESLIEQQSKELKEVSDLITVSNIDELIRIKSKADVYSERLKHLKTEENPHIEALDELESDKLEPPDKIEINILQEQIAHQKFLLKLLTKRDSFVRKAILQKSIPFLNTRLALYLSELGLPHSVKFTHEMTANISQFGHILDFGNLSNGQQARVNLALSFAFRDVLQSQHDNINICMLDEVLDVGLDAVGVKAAAKMLKKQARENKMSMFIISHRDEIDTVFNQKLIVQMADGFSSIRYED